ncbi:MULTISPECIES: acyl carrier protein [unclassified Streptomyces]|uniref:acyl carrier protein n=1 Tax=unclassified Streptomyces TaxID=2593676 RepID=UPI0004C7336C|nr:acyl carrier protein [Streptomyces sp. NRRL F-5727]
MAGTQLPEDVRAGIREIVAEVLEVDASDLTEDSSFVNDFDADSLLVIEIISRFERDLHIRIPKDELAELDTLPEAYELVGKHYAAGVVGA